MPEGDGQPPYYRYNWTERQLYFSAYHIGPATIADYVEGFNRYRPRLLTGYAYSHYSLAKLMLARGLHLDYKPLAIVLSSEKTTPLMRDVIQRAFGARVWEEYSSVENCICATECGHGSLHVSPDFGIVEILDDDGQPLAPGQVGRIVGHRLTELCTAADPLRDRRPRQVGRRSMSLRTRSTAEDGGNCRASGGRRRRTGRT